LAARDSRANSYATGGFGVFHRNLSLTRPTTLTILFCDPFSCGANQVVFFVQRVKPGFNLGAGLEFGMGGGSVKLLTEARYERMFTNHGADSSYVPVTFGVGW
jgi:hypothetical protein